MFSGRKVRPVAVVALVLLLVPAAAGAAPGFMTCQQLKQRCDATVASFRDAVAHVRPDEVDSAAASEAADGYDCQGRYGKAEQTGVFPGRAPEPDLPCAN